jgi:hypothetical protein
MKRSYIWNPDRGTRNVTGAFYSLEGGCLDCRLPESEAPTLLSDDDDDYETFFVKQPETDDETEQACKALEVCCVQALRYGGTNKKIIERLGNSPAFCDHDLDGERNDIAFTFWGGRFKRILKFVAFRIVNAFLVINSVFRG